MNPILFSDESMFYLHAHDSFFLRSDIFPSVFTLTAIMMWVPYYNACLHLVFVERMLKSAMYVQSIVQSSRIMPAHMMPILLNMVCKMLDNILDQHVCETMGHCLT